MTVKSRLLEILELHKGEDLSGERLAEELACTRTAVWKAVKSLQKEGYEICAGQNRGYRLSETTNHLSKEALQLYLRQKDAEVFVFDEVESTNQEARKLAQEGIPHGSVILARRQSKGRGRRGRSFYSPEGGLYLSVVLRPNASLKQALLLTTAAAAAVYRGVQKVSGVDLKIKWVNDLYCGSRKICGILTEAATDFESGEIEFAVVGIGLNLILPEKEQLPEELQGIVTDLHSKLPEGVQPDINLLAAEIVNNLLEESRRTEVSPIYIQQNLIPGHEIWIQDGERSRKAEALSICPDGRLRIREQDGTENLLSYGEVSVRLEEE